MWAQDDVDGAPPTASATKAADAPKVAEPGENAKTAAEMKAYTEEIANTDLTFEMVPIPGGEFTIGSPEDEEGRGEGEGPQRRVSVSPFWMATKEVTWDEYDAFFQRQDKQRRDLAGIAPDEYEKKADAVTRPTKNYTDMTFDMGHDSFPAICMTHLSAKMYCKWLSEKTGHFYRLPTEAEWEFAARAGTDTAYSFGDDAENIDEYAWSDDNADWTYHPVGQKKPNAFGLYDMHGNVAEWCLDQYDPDFYATFSEDGVTKDPYNVPETIYPRTVRGGSWYDTPEYLRSAARMPSTNDWKMQDPQIPQSIWWMTDSIFVGFRVVRPLTEPTEEEKLELQLIPRPEDVPEWGLREGFIHD
ncbi:Hercynine oxygenase [Planctomycetes bacterium LzC2]|uniref:Hercynine oxygenase n=1 Tax=Alienimonas chondri TaxID=2681879 RepID=A0ABX1VF86_9PLAN|nr:Hercynine oxygenase [Alienimonas chondri]